MRISDGSFASVWSKTTDPRFGRAVLIFERSVFDEMRIEWVLEIKNLNKIHEKLTSIFKCTKNNDSLKIIVVINKLKLLNKTAAKI